MYALILVACAAPLVPGEEVLGVDRVATFTYGAPGDRLGASVAARADAWLASAPGSGSTWRDGSETDVSSVWVGWWGIREVRVDASGQVIVDGVTRWAVPDAVAWAAGPHGVLVATGDGVRVLDDRTDGALGGAVDIPAEGARAVAWGEERVLAMVCADTCAAHAWALDGAALGAFAEGGEGGAVGEWDGVAWAGDPAWDDPDGAGRVCAEDGACREGLPGDHLGAAIGGGHAAGTFNKWVVPARARLVPLVGDGPVLALEEGVELRPVELAGDPDGSLVVGAPYAAAGGLPAGAVVEVPR